MNLVFQQLRNFLLVMGIIASFFRTSQAGLNRDLLGVPFVNFEKDESYLNITSIASVLLEDATECGFACLEMSPCFSYNLASFPDVNGKLLCELLPSDKYNNSDKLNASKTFHHFSIPSPCSSWPCQNNGTCISNYSNKRYLCHCMNGFTGKHCQTIVKDCTWLYKSGQRNSGVYTINPDGSGEFNVSCDQTTAGGGWAVFQKRQDGSVDFYRGWADYKQGFGNLNGEFWLGLDKIHRLTNSGNYKLRVDLEDFTGNTAYAEYGSFGVANEGNKYRLSVGSYSGTAGDSLAYHNGYPFTTKDQDNDHRSYANCVVQFKGAWWHNSCYHSSLNGIYHQGQYSSQDGIAWHHWKNTDNTDTKRAEMKIRPVDF